MTSKYDTNNFSYEEVEEFIEDSINWASIALFVVTVFGFAYLGYDYQVTKLKEMTMQCKDRPHQKLVSETIRTNGSVECRYVRDVTGLGVSK